MARLLVGCTTVHEMTPAYHHSQERARTLTRLQLTVMRFSDEYCTRVVEGVNRFQAAARTPEERLQAQRWKTNQCQSVYIDADGPHPALNTLDIVVLATLSRMVIDDVTTHDERAEYLRKTHHELEESAWQLSDPLLTDAQTAQLHDIINRWRARNPLTRSVAAIHFTELAKLTGEPGPEEEHQADSLYSIVTFNPFAERDPAIQEITQTVTSLNE